ncbi:MAG: trigger factor [Terracidiphilus sp.]|nr:trigger factor [Terracidiphilus sp.]
MSSTDSTEEKVQPEQAEATHDEHAGHDHEHDHEGHDHEGHTHGPVLNPDCTRELTLDVAVEEVTKAYKGVTANYKKYARIPGFRAGKVPESVVRRRFAEEIRKDVIDQLLPERFNKAVADLGVRPVGQPQVTELTVEDGQPLHVKAVFEYVPEFSIEGYKDVTVAKPSVEVTEEEFEHEMAELRESRATIEPVEEDRTIVNGDWAEISYKGSVAGDEAADPLAGENALVEIGGKDTVEAFTEILRGARVGQELKAEVTYPADFTDAKLQGKTVSYEVTVKGIKKRTTPELNDEFAKELGAYESLAELQTRVREHMANRKRASVEGETKDKLFAALNEKFTIAIPESLVQEQIDTRLDRGLRALAAQGMTPEQMRKLDFGRLRAAQRDSAAAEVKAQLILDKIAAAEGITISDDDVAKEVQIAAIQSREAPEALEARLKENGGLAHLREQLLRDKTATALYERLPA